MRATSIKNSANSTAKCLDKRMDREAHHVQSSLRLEGSLAEGSAAGKLQAQNSHEADHQLPIA